MTLFHGMLKVCDEERAKKLLGLWKKFRLAGLIYSYIYRKILDKKFNGGLFRLS